MNSLNQFTSNESAEFVHSTCDLFDSNIFHYLPRKSRGHRCDRGIVSINTSGVDNPQAWPLPNGAYFEKQTGLYTKNEPNPWICYDFKNRLIKPTHYSLGSCRDSNYDIAMPAPFDPPFSGLVMLTHRFVQAVQALLRISISR
jgi:hypothetical protein